MEDCVGLVTIVFAKIGDRRGLNATTDDNDKSGDWEVPVMTECDNEDCWGWWILDAGCERDCKVIALEGEVLLTGVDVVMDDCGALIVSDWWSETVWKNGKY